MTQKEKLEEAKRLYETANADQRYVLESLFPELKESEDERIRKELIFWINSEILQCSIQEHADKLKQFIAWIEKQGETKEIIPEDATVDSNEDGLIAETIRYKNERQGEQKFKVNVGDWLIHNERKHIVKVIYATPLIYEVVNKFGDYHTITNNAIENNYHLWTIQDAKDGDVLATDVLTFIFKKRIDNTVFMKCYAVNDKFVIVTGTTTVNAKYVKPATKEQRESLFQKMKETGYEWDADKKELKKLREE